MGPLCLKQCLIVLFAQNYLTTGALKKSRVLRQVLVHLEESLVVARQVGGEVVQVLLLLLPKEVAVLQAALEEVDLFLLHLFALPGVAPISHRSVGLDMEENEYIQGGFFYWSTLKMTKCQTLWKI